MPAYHYVQPKQGRLRQRPHSGGGDPLPVRYRFLDVRCLEHPRPEPMRFIGWGTSTQGQPIAIYACPLCNYREGYAENHRDGQPFRLFYKYPL